MSAFVSTRYYEGKTSLLDSRILVTDPQTPRHFATLGLWDTGASHSMISQEVVAALGLVPLGHVLVSGFQGAVELKTYCVSISFGNGFLMEKMVVVAAKEITDDHHVLLGMDIISQLDFAVTNVGGNTVHSIRFPSREVIDFGQ